MNISKIVVAAAAFLAMGTLAAQACEPGFVNYQVRGNGNVVEVQTDGFGNQLSAVIIGNLLSSNTEIRGECNTIVVGMQGLFARSNLNVQGSGHIVAVNLDSYSMSNLSVLGFGHQILVDGNGGNVTGQVSGAGHQVTIHTNTF